MAGIVETLRGQPADRVAVHGDGLSIGFGRFADDVLNAAANLAARGVGPGTRAAIRTGTVANGHSYANWVAHLASLHLGAAHVSVFEPAALASALQAGMIDCVIGAPGALEKVPSALRQIIFTCDPAVPIAAATDAPSPADDRASRINMTSGTTGKPKFLVWDQAMIDARVGQVSDGLTITTDTILYPLLHVRTTAGFRYPLAVWRAGGSVIIPDHADAKPRDVLGLAQSTLIVASPVQLSERLRQFPDPWEGRDQRTIVVLGGRLPIKVRDSAVATACARLLISYGSTETGSIALGDCASIDRHVGAVGHVRPGVTVEIVDPKGNPVPAGEPGLVRIRTDVMSHGYDGTAPGAATSHFANGRFIPGDVGRLFDDGLLAIEGRAGDTFNVGGWKVNAVDLEAKLAFLPGVDDLCACVMPLAEGDVLAIAVVTRPTVDLKQVAEEIKSRIPRGRTFHLVRIQSVPRNAMGKIPRAMIANRLTAHYGASRDNLVRKNV